MTQQILIEGDIAKVLETRLVAQAPIGSLAALLERRLPTVLPILPDHTRIVAFDPDNRRGTLIVEQRPIRTNITLHLNRNDHHVIPPDNERIEGDRAIFNLLFPYQYFTYAFEIAIAPDERITGFSLHTVYLYWSPKAITKLDDPLWPAQLPNVDPQGIVCWGNTTAPTDTLAERIDGQVKTFSATVFNSHLQLRRGGFRTFTEWERTSDDPTNYTRIPMFENAAPTTARDVIDILTTGNLPVADPTTDTNWIPDPPPAFTIGRATEWFQALPENQRRIYLTALQRALTEEPTDD